MFFVCTYKQTNYNSGEIAVVGELTIEEVGTCAGGHAPLSSGPSNLSARLTVNTDVKGKLTFLTDMHVLTYFAAVGVNNKRYF